MKCLFLILYFISSYVLADYCYVTSFNVGQGNGTLFNCPYGAPFLVDAGSSWLPGNDKHKHKDKTIENICKAIIEHLKENKDVKDLYIVISHHDLDHYSWIEEIIGQIPEELKKSKGFDRFNQTKLNINFILGGKQNDYNKITAITLNDYTRVGTVYAEAAIDPSKNNATTKFECGKLGNHPCYAYILSSEYTEENKNNQSIVMKFACSKVSVLTTGDITKKITDKIIKAINENKIKNQPQEELKSTILQASHHGADSEGSNNEYWLKALDPKYVVFSAGMRSDYSHPKASVVRNILNYTKLAKTNTHLVQFHDDLPLYDYHKFDGLSLGNDLKTFARYTNGYCVAVTKLGIFNTINSGNIKFIWEENDVIPNIIYAQSNQQSLKDFVLSKITNQKLSEMIGCGLDKDPDLIGLNLSGLKLADEHNIHAKLNDQKTLIALDLTNNPGLTNALNQQNIYPIAALVKSLQKLKTLEVDKTISGQVEISKEWNNRGLNFK